MDTQQQTTDRRAVHAILNAAAHAVLGVAADGTIDFVNQRVEAVLGYRPEDLLGKRVDSLVPDRMAAEYAARRAEYLSAPGPRPMGSRPEFVMRRADGSECAVDVALTPVETTDGPWVITSIADVSQRRAHEARIEDLSRAYLTLAKINQVIVRAADELTLYRDVCRVAVQDGGYRGAWVGVPGAGRIVPLAFAGPLDDYLAELDVRTDPDDPRGQHPAAAVLRTAGARYTVDSTSDADHVPWHDLARRHGIGGKATLPLRRSGRPVAALILITDLGTTITDDMRPLLQSVADNISFALDGFEAAEQLRRSMAHRNELLDRLVAAQEDERARIAADVHDDSIQSLAALDLRLGLLEQRIEEAAPHLAPAVRQLQETVTHVSTGLRDLLFELEPAEGEAALADLLREAAAHVFEHDRVEWSVDTGDAPPPALPEGSRRQALRIAKEALINARNHARASHVEITVATEDGGVLVSVRDDGVGLAPDGAKSAPGHRGLVTMRDRAEVTGGWCRIEDTGAGAAVRFWIPLALTP